MSCTIKILRRPESRAGSVLMEFVIVLPVYIALFGMLFLIGDMGLKAAFLAVGDRAVTFDAGDRTGYSYTPFTLKQWVERCASLTSSTKTFRAQENFKGAWSWQAAGSLSFLYKLQSWGGALISYPYLYYNGGASGLNDDLGRLVYGGTVKVQSKDNSSVRVYNYYTLKRTELARRSEAYRNWNEGQLTAFSGSTDQYWHSHVFEEDFADSVAEHLESTSQSGDELPDPPSERKIYKRYSTFVDWSE